MSVLATIMSFLYSFIGLGLSIAKATGEPDSQHKSAHTDNSTC